MTGIQHIYVVWSGSVLLQAVLEKAEDSDLRYSKCPGGQVISSPDFRAQLFKALLA